MACPLSLPYPIALAGMRRALLATTALQTTLASPAAAGMPHLQPIAWTMTAATSLPGPLWTRQGGLLKSSQDELAESVRDTAMEAARTGHGWPKPEQPVSLLVALAAAIASLAEATRQRSLAARCGVRAA